MQWYDRYKMATNQPWNWNQFNKGLLATVGTLGAVMSLILYFNMSREQAEIAVKQQPQKVEQALKSMPPQVIQQALQMAQQPSATTPPQSQPPINQIPPAVSQQSQGLVSAGIMKPQLERHEGRKHSVYDDSALKPNPTIGIGFNLNRGDARQLISQVGANYDQVRNGQQSLTDAQIDRLFDITLNEAFGIANNYIPDLASHPQEAQRVVIDMSFNLGPKINTFNTLRSAILNRNYNAAAIAMTQTKWYGQVASRGPALVNMMKQSAIKTQTQNTQPIPR